MAHSDRSAGRLRRYSGHRHDASRCPLLTRADKADSQSHLLIRSFVRRSLVARIRPSAKMSWRAKSGLLFSKALYWSGVIAATLQSSTAQARAERGLPSKKASSPNTEPAPTT